MNRNYRISMPSPSLAAIKKTRTATSGRATAQRRRVAQKQKQQQQQRTCSAKQASCSESACAVGLTDLPDELIEAIVRNLPGRDLAAAALVCSALQRVSDQESVWQSAYRCDIDPEGPPIEHQDHLIYGKSTRWLYGLMRTPEGTLRTGPTGRLTGRLVHPNGVKSGEFAVGPPKGTSPHALLLDGYGADLVNETNTSTVNEGFYKCGVRVDAGRYATFALDRNTALRQNRVAEFVRRGPIVDSLHHGICRSEWPSGEYAAYDFVGSVVNGRCISVTSRGVVRSGQRVRGSWNLGRGVQRLPDGTLNEYAPCDGDHQDMAILVTRTPRGVTHRALPAVGSLQDAGEHIVDYGLEPRPTISTDAAVNVRMQTRGYIIVANARRILFVGVDNAHADRAAAGRRWIANLLRSDEPSKDTPSVFDHLARLAPPEPAKSLSVNAILGLSRASYDDLLVVFEGAGLEMTTPPPVATQRETNNDSAGDQRNHAAVPYGVAYTADSDPSSADPRVRCFLTGDMVPAQDCTLYSSGRFYCAERLAQWTRFARHDPETGDAVPAPTGGLLWNDWMRPVPSHVLAWAARDLYTTLALSGKGNSGCTITHESLLRNAVAGFMGVTLRPGIEILCAAARAKVDAGVNAVVASGGDDGLAALTPGFERIALQHIELRHPEWDPRGPWSFEPSTEPLPDDLTVGEHERHPGGPPDAFVRSHGILTMAFEPCVSFVGAQFTGVFFFGQRFEGASFIAATLDRCAFMGCTLDDECAFDRALLSGCRFYCCTNKAGAALDIDALAKRGAIIA
nr:F-box domain [Pandoravirus massiliensis]